MSEKLSRCSDCDGSHAGASRRQFLQTGVATAALASGAFVGAPRLFAEDQPAADAKPATCETLVKQLFDSLNDKQKSLVAFPFDHELRSKVDNNWFITKARVAKDFNADQQRLILDIFKGLHSPEYVDQVLKQVEHDNRSKGVDDCAIAMFGEPGGKFEFVLTGRHTTRRCDGNSVDGVAFGGPIFYGHAAGSFNEKPDHPGNVYWYQAKRANELYQALDGKQREKALRTDPRGEQQTNTVKLSGKTTDLHGVPFAELSSDQKELARKVMDDVLAPFRQEDREESLKLIDSSGWDDLHMAYYKNMDIGNDSVWDVWQIEGPNMIWYFRGSPHVHTWVHIRDKAQS